MKFYTYLWLRYDGSPYYVGKGCGARAWKWHRGFKNPPQRERVIIQHWPDEQSAFEAEKFLIALYGRIDLGTGCLRNQSDGGTGGATRRGKKFPNRRSDFGARRSKATRAKMSIAQSRVVSNRGRFTKGHPFVGRRKKNGNLQAA